MDVVECGTILADRSARLSLIFCELEACLGIRETCLEQKPLPNTRIQTSSTCIICILPGTGGGGKSIPFRPDMGKFHSII